METRKRKFFAEILNAYRENQLQTQASLKRRKQRNDGVQVCVCVCRVFLNYSIAIKNNEALLSCKITRGKPTAASIT